MKGVLLIGGNGFIGQALARALAARGEAVTVLSRRPPASAMAGVRWQPGDLNDLPLLATLLAESRAVVHLATTSTPGRHVREPARDAVENLLPLLRLLEAMNDRPELPLIYLSSGGAIYGDPAYLPVDERHVLAPLSHHAAGKAAAEQYLGVFARQGHATAILRPANVYGPGQPLQTGFGVIRTLLEHLRRGTPLTIWGDGETTRDFLHIDDMVAACLAVLDAPASGTFNLGSGNGLSLNALCRLVERVTGRAMAIRHQPARGVDVQTVILDSSAFRQRYGWQPRVSLDEGLRATWQWLLDQP
ncbi:MAG: NAD-dependent epimerase/dehydratase family protein [Gallionellaceae bacterium]|nr:NAD-dependent epimerase/dehydratase family protein [Gallionellaceae bacterium]